MSSFRTMLMLFPALLAGPQALAQHRSIVGGWSTTPAGCDTNIERLTIQPMALRQFEYACTFTTVRREGATVIWTGHCNDDEAKPVTVIAREANGRLTLTYPDGKKTAPMIRCPR